MRTEVKPRNGSALPNALLDALGVGAGIAAYAYAAGGAVEYLRFTGSHLPASQALSLISSRQILATGLIVALAAPIVWLLVRIVLWARGKTSSSTPPPTDRPRANADGDSGASDSDAEVETAPRTETRPDRVERAGLASLADFVGYGTALSTFAGIVFLIASSLTGEAPHLQEFAQVLALAGGVGAVAAACVWQIFAGRPTAPNAVAAPSVPAVPGFRGLTAIPARWMVGILLGLTLVGGASVAYFVPLSLPSVVVRLTGGRCIRGLYLSRDSSSVTLVDGEARRLLSLSTKEVSAVEIGSGRRAASARIEAVTKCPARAGLANPVDSRPMGSSQERSLGIERNKALSIE